MVEVLDHWEAVGDISEHKMCADCRSKISGKNECPFCKEVLMKEEFLKFIDKFTGTVQRNAREQQQVRTLAEMVEVATQSAQLLERWQLFEMMHEGNPRLVQRVAKLLLEPLAQQLAQVKGCLKNSLLLQKLVDKCERV